MKNYYDVLGVNEQSTSADITKAFKDLAKKHHPDRGGDESKFKEINEAYATLKDTQKRHEYDTMRKFGGSGGGDHPFFNEDIFGDFFSGFGNNDFTDVPLHTWSGGENHSTLQDSGEIKMQVRMDRKRGN